MNGMWIVYGLLAWTLLSIVFLLLWAAVFEIGNYFAQRRNPRPGFIHDIERARLPE